MYLMFMDLSLDIVGLFQSQEATSLLSFYSPIVRHYSSALSSWEGFLFRFTRVKALVCQVFEADSIQQENASFMQLRLPEDVPQSRPAFASPALCHLSPGEGTTTILVKCRSILVTFTPLTLPASVCLEEDIKNIVRQRNIIDLVTSLIP